MPQLPRYSDNLADYVADLRSLTFSSQNRLAKQIGLAHTTISRYESGRLIPPFDYLAFLVDLVAQRFIELGADEDALYVTLLADLNQVIRIVYPDQQPFQHWSSFMERQSLLLQKQDLRAGIPPQTDVVSSAPTVDWGDAPDVSGFVGRKEEVAALTSALLTDRCRLITLLGMGGMGKTALATKIAIDQQGDFDCVIWRSLRNAPYAEQLTKVLFAALLPKAEPPDGPITEQWQQLVDQLQQRRCLLILDNIESIIGAGEPYAAYRPGYEAYGQIFRLLATVSHQSCILLTSREKILDLVEFEETDSGPIRALSLRGLDRDEAQALLAGRQLQGSDESWERLVYLYSGNPLALKLIADTIQGLFSRDIDTFLNTESTIFGDIRRLLAQQFDRVPPLGQQVLFWLVVVREPIPITALRTLLVSRTRTSVLVDVLQSLQRRSLVESHNGGFFLQNVVAEFVNDELIAAISDEIDSGALKLFHQIALMTATAPDPVRRTQERLILGPIADEIAADTSRASVQHRLERIQLNLLENDGGRASCAAGNLLNLKRHLNLDISGADYTGLSVWHAYLRDTKLTDVNFRGCDLSHTVFDNAFMGVNMVALSPDGKYLAVASGADILVWQTDTSLLYQHLQKHDALVWQVQFSTDGGQLFTASEDGWIYRWELHSGLPSPVLHIDDHRIWSMAIHPSNRLIATGGGDGTVKTWDVETGSTRTSYAHHSGAVRSVSFDPTGRWLASAGEDARIFIFQVDYGGEGADISINEHTDRSTDRPADRLTDRPTEQAIEEPRMEPILLDGHTDRVTSLDFSADGTRLVSASRDQTVRVWSIRPISQIAVFTGHKDVVSAVRWRDDNTVISGSYDTTIHVWQIGKHGPKFLLRGHEQSVGSISLDASGRLLASGSYDRTARLWNLETGEQIEIIRGKTFQIFGLAISSDNQKVASGGADYLVRVWGMESTNFPRIFSGHTRWVSSVAFHPNAPVLASGSYDRTVRLWDLKSGRCLRVLAGHGYWVLAVAFEPMGRWLASGGSDSSVRIWEVGTGRQLFCFDHHEAAVGTLAFHTQEPLLASGDEQGVVHIWHVENGREVAVLPISDSAVKFLSFADDGNVLIAVDGMDRVYRWPVPAVQGEEVDDEESSPHLPLAKHEMERLADVAGPLLAIAPNRALCKGSAGGSALLVGHLTEPSSKDERRIEQPHGGSFGAATHATFSDDGTMLVAGGIDGLVYVWRVDNGELLAVLRGSRLYEGMRIGDVSGISNAEIDMLMALGAVDE